MRKCVSNFSEYIEHASDHDIQFKYILKQNQQNINFFSMIIENSSKSIQTHQNHIKTVLKHGQYMYNNE